MPNIKDEILLSEEISQYVKLKKSGNLMWGLCPFHSEKTPSFAVNDEKGFFHCFGCGKHGDIFSFSMYYHNLDFKSAINKLCESHRLPVPKKKDFNSKKQLMEIMQYTSKIYMQNLQKQPNALEYLSKRGVNAEMCQKFSIGFACNTIDILLKEGYDIEKLKELGICSINNLDRMRSRIIFPIISRNQEVIAFAGRVLDDSLPKYINSPETKLFHKSFHLFNENSIIYNKPVILVEGYMDVISLSNYFDNVVAFMGTNLSNGQALTISKLTNKIILMFDGDDAGKRAIEKNINILLGFINPEHEVIICELEDGKDPDNIIHNSGVKEINRIIDDGLSISNWLIKQIKVIGIENPTQIALGLKKIDEILHLIKNKHVKQAFEIFFNKYYKNLSIINKKQRPKISNSEDILITLLLYKYELLCSMIEEIMGFCFTNQHYEEIRLKIVDELTLNTHLNNNFIQNILIRNQKKIDSIFKKYNLSFIIGDEGFVKRCMLDLIISLKNKKSISIRPPSLEKEI